MTTATTPPKITDFRYRISQQTPFFYGWIIVVTGFLATFVGGGLQSFTGSLFLKPMTEELGWTVAQYVFASTLRTYAGAAMMPILGPLVDRHGPRAIMIASASLGLCAALLLSQVHSLWQFYAVFIALGITGQGAAGLLTSATISRWFVNKRGRAAAWATLGNALSGSVLVPFATIMMAHYGWRGAWLANGLLFIPMIPLTFLLVRRPEDLGLRPDGAKSDAEAASQVRHRRGGNESTYAWTLKQAIRTKTFWILAATSIIGSGPIGAVIQYEVSFLRDEKFAAGFAATVLSIHATGAIGARFVWGWLVERFHVRICQILNYAACATALSLFLIAVKFHVGPLVLVSAGLYGMNVGGSAVLSSIVTADYWGRESVGAIRGVQGPIQTVLTAFFPVVAAFMRDSTGTYWLPFFIMVGMFATGSFMALLARPAKPPTTPNNQGPTPHASPRLST